MVDPLGWDAEVRRAVDRLNVGTEIAGAAGVVVVGEAADAGVAGETVGVDAGVEVPGELLAAGVGLADAAVRAEPAPLVTAAAVARGPGAAVLRGPFSFLSCPGGPSPFGPRPSACAPAASWLAV